MFKQIIRYGVMASTVRSHRADRGSIPRIGAFFFFLKLNKCGLYHISFFRVDPDLITFYY